MCGCAGAEAGCELMVDEGHRRMPHDPLRRSSYPPAVDRPAVDPAAVDPLAVESLYHCIYPGAGAQGLGRLAVALC